MAKPDSLLLGSPPAFSSNLLDIDGFHTHNFDKVSAANSTQQSGIERAQVGVPSVPAQRARCTGRRATSSVQQHCRCRRFQVPSGTRTACELHAVYHVTLCHPCRCNTACNVRRQPACRQARHFAHTPLHVSHANQRSNNKRNGEDPSPAAAVNTLSLLELLLTQPKLDTDTASETSLLVDDTSAMPDSSLADAHLTTPGISHQLPTPSDIWTQTWQPIEPSSPVHAKQAQAAAASQLQMPVALPSLRFWRQQQQQQQLPGHSSQKARDKSVLQQHEKGLAAATMMRNAQMQLQGIEPAARLQLMVLCMASLEDLTESLKGVSIRYTHPASDWCSFRANLSSHAAIALYAQCVSCLHSHVQYLTSDLLLLCYTSQNAQVANHTLIACCITSTAMLTVFA